MLFIIVTFILGLLILLAGFVVWKKQRIDLLKNRLHGNVTDVPGYTAAFGKTLVFMGAFLVVSGILLLLPFMPSWISSLFFYGGIGVSVVLILMIQHKYNGTFLSK